MNEQWRKPAIIGLRMVQLLAGALVALGALWALADVLQLTLPQFMVLYGFVGVVAPEFPIRLLKHKTEPGQKKFRR